MEPNRWSRLILNFDGKNSNFTGKFGGGSVYFGNDVLLKASSAGKICHLRSREACQDKLSTTETVCWRKAWRQPDRITPFNPFLLVGVSSSRFFPRRGCIYPSRRSTSYQSPGAESGTSAVPSVTAVSPKTHRKQKKMLCFLFNLFF